MGEVAFVISDAGDGLRERLNQEISAFNVAATSLADAALLAIAVRETVVPCARGCPGGPGVGAVTSSFLGAGRPAWAWPGAAGYWPRRSGRSRGVAAARWP
jgi:hypothetical protein